MNKIKDILTSYFNRNFILDRSPQVDDKIIIGMAIFFGILFLIGLAIIFFMSTKAKKMAPIAELRSRLSTNFISFGVLGLFFVFFIWQQIPYLSTPILTLALILVFLVNLGYNIVYWRKFTIPAIRNFKQEVKYRKYLPKKNKI